METDILGSLPRGTLAVALAALWELAGRTLVSDARTALLLPLPSRILATAVDLLREGTLLAATLHSGARVAAASLAAVAVGVPLGALIGRGGRLAAVLDAPMRLLRPVPPVAWVPLTLLWFGVTELQQAVLLFLAALFVVATGVAHAVAGVPRALLDAARNLGAAERVVALRVAVPAALPGVAASVREGVGTAWFVLVAAEFLSAAQGLGVLILEGRDLLEPDRAFVGMLALGGCAAASDTLLAALARRIGRGT